MKYIDYSSDDDQQNPIITKSITKIDLPDALQDRLDNVKHNHNQFRDNPHIDGVYSSLVMI